MAYDPTLHTTTNKALGIAQATPTDARSYYYDSTLFTYRTYNSTAEVLSYLTAGFRTGNFPIYIRTGSTTKRYSFKNGIGDTDLIEDAPVEIPLNAKGSSYTLVITDSGSLISMSVPTANTVVIPPNSSVAFNQGTQILVLQSGAGQTTIAPGAGVTIIAADGYFKLRVQWSMATLIKTGTDSWVIAGDLTA